MKKNEAKFTTLFKRYLENRNTPSGAYEIKHIPDSKARFTFTDLKEHQLQALLAVDSSNTFAYKIPDDGFQKPFDLVTLTAPAYVVLAFEHARAYSTYVMDVYTYIVMRDTVRTDYVRNSVTEHMLEEIIQNYKFDKIKLIVLPKGKAKR